MVSSRGQSFWPPTRVRARDMLAQPVEARLRDWLAIDSFERKILGHSCRPALLLWLCLSRRAALSICEEKLHGSPSAFIRTTCTFDEHRPAFLTSWAKGATPLFEYSNIIPRHFFSSSARLKGTQEITLPDLMARFSKRASYALIWSSVCLTPSQHLFAVTSRSAILWGLVLVSRLPTSLLTSC